MTFESCEDLLLRITELKSALIYMERTLLETHFESCIIPHLKAPAEIVLSVHSLRLYWLWWEESTIFLEVFRELEIKMP